MGTKRNLAILFLCLFSFSCVHKKYFTAKPGKRVFQNPQLKINGTYINRYYTLYPKDSIGYYLEYPSTWNTTVIKKRIYQTDSLYSSGYYFFFLYPNGMVAMCGGSDSLKMLKEYARKEFLSDRYYEYGGYKIDNDTVTIQLLRSMPGFHWCVLSFYGKIINDSTIFIYDCFLPDRKDYDLRDFYLHFHETNKPDSINRWMKKKWYWAE